MLATDRCPCGSGETYAECCGRFHDGAADAATARALMASRYSAFVTGDAAYLVRTWHPSTRPRDLHLDDGLQWLRLEVVDVVAGGPFDAAGTVEFRAHYRSGGDRGVLQERSSFVREDGRWLYVTGSVS